MTKFYDRVQELIKEQGSANIRKQVYGNSTSIRMNKDNQQMRILNRFKEKLGYRHLFLIEENDNIEFFANPEFLQGADQNYFKAYNRLKALQAELKGVNPLSLGKIYQNNSAKGSQAIEQVIQSTGANILWLPEPIFYQGISVDEFYHSDFIQALIRPLTQHRKPTNILKNIKGEFYLKPLIKQMENLGYSFVHLFDKKNDCVFSDGLSFKELNNFLMPKIKKHKHYKRKDTKLRANIDNSINRFYFSLDNYEIMFSMLNLTPKYFIPKGYKYNSLDDIVEID